MAVEARFLLNAANYAQASGEEAKSEFLPAETPIIKIAQRAVIGTLSTTELDKVVESKDVSIRPIIRVDNRA